MSVTRYDVNGPSSVFEDVNGSLVDFKDYAALEDKRAALAAELKQSKIDADCYKKGMEASNARLVQLAAENAALKSKAAELVHEASGVYSAYNSSITEHDGDFMDMQTLQEMQCVETPATDAFLAEVRAQGVDLAIAELNQLAERSEKEAPVGAGHHRSAALFLQLISTQLRKGGAE